MKKLILTIAFASPLLAFAQKPKLVDSITPVKTQLVNEWRYKYYDEFGVKTYADSNQLADKIIFHDDGTYDMTQNSAVSHGAWKYDPASYFLFMTDSYTKQTKNYRLGGITKSQLALKDQDPKTLISKILYYKKNIPEPAPGQN